MSDGPIPQGARRLGVGALATLALVVAAFLDPWLALAARGAPPALGAFGRFVTSFGTSEYMFAYSGLIAAAALIGLGRGLVAWDGVPLRRIVERALFFFAVVALSGLADQALKHLIGRARPKLMAVDGPYSFHPMSIADALASFPSGHTTSAFAAAVALGHMRPGWRPALLGAAALVGTSRVLVGAHYPSDVVGGAVLGSAVAVALARRRGPTLVGARRAAAPSLRPAAARPETMP